MANHTDWEEINMLVPCYEPFVGQHSETSKTNDSINKVLWYNGTPNVIWNAETNRVYFVAYLAYFS